MEIRLGKIKLTVKKVNQDAKIIVWEEETKIEEVPLDDFKAAIEALQHCHDYYFA